MASVIGLGVTIFLTLRATQAAQRSAFAAEKAIEGEGRPHVLVSGVDVEDITLVGEHEIPHIKFLYHNHGTGPAWLTGHAHAFDWKIKGANPGTFEISSLTANYWPIAPGSGWGKENFTTGNRQVYDDWSMSKIIDGSWDMYVLGGVEYVDAERRSHRHSYVYK
ncbi:hypothetical protein V4889_25045, partial [Ralstonia solanacearum species complex bacterium KE101]|uniref:hypothetical protein n=1 Tax=Ralstonia solanacearum species complex bacterium KE101 TaxID=3119587 RepID=UPI002FC2CEE3